MKLLKSTTFIFAQFILLSIFQNSYAQCTHTLRMTDTFGDGWNGGTVSVSVNGVNVLTNVSLGAGFGPSDQTFSANTGDLIRVYETATGSYPTEMRVQLLDGGALSILGPLDPNAGTITTGGSTVNGNCPGPMAFASCTTTQNNTTNVYQGASNQEVIGINIVTTGSTSPLSATSFTVNANGTTLISDINSANSAKIYYTGTSSAFATTTLFGQATPTIANFNITGSQTLSSGTNYFWLVYTIQPGAVIGDVIDGRCTSLTVGSAQTPTVTAPVGNRPIVAAPPSPGGVATGLETWIKANAGFTFGAPSTWTNQAAGTATVVNGSPNINTVSTAYNYNPYIDFTAPVATLDGGLATNRQCIKLSGYDGILGIDYKSLFFTFQLSDLTRLYTHAATVQDVTFSTPANGTWHGDANGATASILLEAYDVADFGTGAPVNTWQRNGVNIASNSNHSSSKHILSAVSQTGGGSTLNRFLGGQADQFPASSFAGHVRDWKGPAAEIIGYTAAVSATDRQKIHSYLGVKYGLTLTQDYLATDGSTVFTTSAPYNSNIIGLTRDDAEGLIQRQSHNDNDIVRIYKGALAASNAANVSTFASDRSYVMTGANTGAMCASAASNAEVPVACGLYSRIEREWKVTRTNMAETFTMDFQLDACALPGSVNPAELRLLVDDDGNFGAGTTSCYDNADGTGIVITYSNPTITVSNISTTHIPNNATRFITIGSKQASTPLPVELLSFDAKLNEDKRTVTTFWSTASENNNDYFIIEKSIDAVNWELMNIVDGAGTSTTLLNYSLLDLHPILGNNYYRLKQVDFDGEVVTSEIRLVPINESDVALIYPNPASTTLFIQKSNIDKDQITVSDQFGKVVSVNQLLNGNNCIKIDVSTLSQGIYFIKISGISGVESHKVVVK